MVIAEFLIIKQKYRIIFTKSNVFIDIFHIFAKNLIFSLLMNYLRTLLLTSGITISVVTYAQKNSVYQQYIDTYKSAAIDQMRRYKIPASITLSQALLESGAGKSRLATQANNHFGIKVGGGWNGPYILANDDAPNEKFRKYDSVEQSYEDHSILLTQSKRYSSLFTLDPMDYKGWARGLKACGYATLATYAERLISVIETYDLHQYDEDKWGLTPKRNYTIDLTKVQTPAKPVVTKHRVVMVNGIQTIVAKDGDTWASIAKERNISLKKLMKFNEADSSVRLTAGTNVFLAKKAKKAEAKYKDTWYKIKAGDSMYSISQQYGVQLKYLYKMNFKDATYIPLEGDLLKVR